MLSSKKNGVGNISFRTPLEMRDAVWRTGVYDEENLIPAGSAVEFFRKMWDNHFQPYATACERKQKSSRSTH